jgi:hypothetical protein
MLVVAVSAWAIGILVGGFLFLKDRRRHNVFFGRPVAQIDQSATFAAEGEIRVSFGVGGPAANWALMLHASISARSFIRFTIVIPSEARDLSGEHAPRKIPRHGAPRNDNQGRCHSEATGQDRRRIST